MNDTVGSGLTGQPQADNAERQIALAAVDARATARDGRRRWVWLAAAVSLSLAGSLISAHLLLLHLRLPTPAYGLLDPFCGGEGGACDQVLASRWGGITIGRVETNEGLRPVTIPTALIGVAYFGAVAIWYLFVGRANSAGRWWHLIPMLVVTAGACFSVWLLHVMRTELGMICRLCAAAHAANGGLVLATVVLWPKRVSGRGEPHAAPAVPSARLAISGVALAVAFVLLVVKTLDAGVRGSQRDRLIERLETFVADAEVMAHMWQRQEPRDIAVGPDDPVRGPPDAAHTVVVFSDFSCPHCRSLARLLEERVRSLPGVTLRVVFKYHPLDRSCNDNVPVSAYPGSCRLACLAEAVLQRSGNDAFWQIHDLLFANQEDLSPGRMRELAGRVGLAADEFDAAISRELVRQRVAACVAQARALSVSRTPTVFLDGRVVEAWNRIGTWERILSGSASSD